MRKLKKRQRKERNGKHGMQKMRERQRDERRRETSCFRSRMFCFESSVENKTLRVSHSSPYSFRTKHVLLSIKQHKNGNALSFRFPPPLSLSDCLRYYTLSLRKKLPAKQRVGLFYGPTIRPSIKRAKQPFCLCLATSQKK